jgi:group I intron endonuclease
MNKKDMNKSGIYCVKNLINNKVYIGSAKNLRIRKNQHFGELRRNEHGNPHLQFSFNKYGGDNFSFIILEFVDDLNILIDRENFYINFYQSNNSEFGYNIRLLAQSNLGWSPTLEQRKQMSNSHIGLQAGEKHPMFGKPRSEETKQKIREKRANQTSTVKGMHHSEESKRKNREAHLGKKASEETKKKQSQALKGRRSPTAKLTEKEVLEIKILLLNKKSNKLEIAELYGVSTSAIYDIGQERTWKNVKL